MQKKYTFELELREGNDEFWELLNDKAGCDEVKDLIVNAMDSVGMQEERDYKLLLTRFVCK